MARNRRRQKSKKQKSTPSRLLRTLAKWLIVFAVLGAIAGAAGVAGLFYYFGRDLPELLSRDDYNPPQVSRIFASNGELIAEFHPPGERRTLVPLEEIPTIVQHAFMAAEDSEFMSHSGIDYLGMIRALYYAVRYDRGMRGTSTITQQLVKNLVLTPERAIERKIQEIILARELEHNLTKEDILYMYLNTIYLGHGNHGVEEASWRYFGKSVRDLEVHEAALLAGLTNGPETNTPVRNMEGAMRRRSFVLRQLWEKGFINEGTYHEAMEKEIVVANPAKTFPHLGRAPYFVEHVRKEIVESHGRQMLMEGGLRIHTTLDLTMQDAAERAARDGLRAYDQRRRYYRPKKSIDEKQIDKFIEDARKSLSFPLEPRENYDAVVTAIDVEEDRVTLQLGPVEATLLLEPRSRIVGEGSEEKPLDEVFKRGDILRVHPTTTVTEETEQPIDVRFETSAEAALIALDPHTREVRALVGGYDFELNEYDHATQARRQTGSAFKTIIFAAALEERIITPATIYLDSPSVYQLHDGESWSPRNSDGKWRGPIRVREGLAASRNVVAVRVLDDLGIQNGIDFSRRIGVKSELVPNYTMVMGSSEMPPIELTNTYATFASGGNYAEPRFLNRVESALGDRQLYQTHSEPVLAQEIAYLTTSLLESTISGYIDSNGTYRGGTAYTMRQIGHPIAGKTGTTNDSRDAWFIGYLPDLVVGVWVGFSDNSSLGPGQYGGNTAGPIFQDFLTEYVGDREPLQFEEPQTGITSATIDPITGKLARTGGFEEVFLVGTAPTEYAPAEEEDSGEDFFLNQFQ